MGFDCPTPGYNIYSAGLTLSELSQCVLSVFMYDILYKYCIWCADYCINPTGNYSAELERHQKKTA